MKKLTSSLLILCMTLNAFAGMTITDRLKLRVNGVVEFEGSTNNNFETTVGVVDPTADNVITLQDGTGTVAFLSDITAGAITGSGTIGTLAVFTASDAIGDSSLREAANQLIIENGANDVTIDYSNVTSAVQYNTPDGTGTMVIEGVIAANTFALTSATDGINVPSSLTETAGSVTNSSGSFFTAGLGGTGFGIDGSNFLRFDSALFTMRFGGAILVNWNAGGTGFVQPITLTDQPFTIVGTTPLVRWQRISGAKVEEKLDLVLKGLTRTQQIQSVTGTKAVYGTFDSTTAITTDNATVTTVYTANTSFKFTTTTAGSAWDPGTVIFTPPLAAAATPLVGEVYHCTTGGTLTQNDSSDSVPVLNVVGNYLLITSDSATAADRTREISTTYGSGAAVAVGHKLTIEFNTSSSEKAEITGVLSVAGGTLTFNAGAAASIQQILAVQFNGTAYVTQDGIQTIIP